MISKFTKPIRVNYHQFFCRAKAASLRDVAVRSCSADDGPFNIKVFLAVA